MERLVLKHIWVKLLSAACGKAPFCFNFETEWPLTCHFEEVNGSTLAAHYMLSPFEVNLMSVKRWLIELRSEIAMQLSLT